MNNKKSKIIVGFAIALILCIGNYGLSYASSKNNLKNNLSELNKIVEKIEKTSTKKVAKKKIKEIKKIEKKIDKLKINERVKEIAKQDATEVKSLCYEVKNNKKLTDIAKLKAENCKFRIKSTEIINKNIKNKNLDDIIRKEAAKQLNKQFINFNDKVLSVVSSGKNYKTEELSKAASEIRSQTLSINTSYFKVKDYTKLDIELMDAILDANDAMKEFSKGKLTVGEYIKKRTNILKISDKYGPFDLESKTK